MTNEKGLVARAGLGAMDALLARLTPEPRSLADAVTRAGTLVRECLEAART
ncbi:hypothetical protein [Streptomyces violaceorubidus]|uniref:hypothetical protein n=1 Tax=Streptomyces violaceorubidus TaxID=284042 RepID=UPI003D9DF61A